MTDPLSAEVDLTGIGFPDIARAGEADPRAPRRPPSGTRG